MAKTLCWAWERGCQLEWSSVEAIGTVAALGIAIAAPMIHSHFVERRVVRASQRNAEIIFIAATNLVTDAICVHSGNLMNGLQMEEARVRNVVRSHAALAELIRSTPMSDFACTASRWHMTDLRILLPTIDAAITKMVCQLPHRSQGMAMELETSLQAALTELQALYIRFQQHTGKRHKGRV